MSTVSHLGRKYMCRQRETCQFPCADNVKLVNLQKIAQAVNKLVRCHRSGKGHVTTEWYPFVKFLARGGYLFFN
jgi:hypothetical protein